MKRLPPQRHEEWQHFKEGKKCKVMGISSYQEKLLCTPKPYYYAQHTETSQKVFLSVHVFDGFNIFPYECEDGLIEPAQSHLALSLEDGMSFIGTPHVVYTEYPSLLLWARPLSNFMSKVPELDCYRFQKISDD